MAFSLPYTLCLYTFCLKCLLCLDTRGWNYINLHCRDNDNSPVDWWFLYKPASELVPFFEMGRNFTFVTPETVGRFRPSDKYITSNSMLQHTLAPLFRPTYSDSLAYIVYDKNIGDKGSIKSLSRGILMAGETTGIWLEHSVPDLVNLQDDRPSFPQKEGAHGHIALCLSVELETVNAIARNLKTVSPKIVYSRIPTKLQHLLPDWNLNNTALQPKSQKIQVLEFKTNDYLRVEFYTKPPGIRDCLYKRFARKKKIYLDVYGQTDEGHLKPICGKIFGLRSIRSISIKYPYEIYYLRKQNEYMRFAVSTAAKWQSLGSHSPQYWVCVSNMERDDTTGVGGDLTCVHDYRIWLTFDNLKVEEPHC